VRSVLVALVLALIAGPPAQAATSLAHVEQDTPIALAGDAALFARDDGARVSVFEVPLNASARAQSRQQIEYESFEDAVVTLGGSAQRAGITVVTGGDLTDPHYLGQVFSGPPAGPWPELARVTSGAGAFAPVAEQVDGENLFVVEASDEAERVTVREAGGPSRVIETLGQATLPRFAGDMEAELGGDDNQTLLVRDWRTGAKHTTELGDSAQTVDVSADGTALVGFESGGVLRVAPDGTPSAISRGGELPRFAGAGRIVYAVDDGLVEVDPGARPRPIGVPTQNLETFDVDDQHVLWSANGCLLVADLTAPLAEAPDPGLCARSEVQIVHHDARVRPDGRVPVRLHCVAAPGACNGMLRAEIRSHRSPALRFTVPTGRSATFMPRLPRAALRGRGYQELYITATAVDPAGRRNIDTGGVTARVG
jgi:hypothetical protein